MAGGANQYSNLDSMRRAQQFAGKNKFGRAKEAWEAGGGEWSDQAHQALKQLGGVSSGRLDQALKFGQGGLFGRAAQQIGLGGGQWGEGYNDVEDGVGGLFRDYFKANPEVDTGAFNYGDISDDDLAQAQRFAQAGMMGRAKGLFGDSGWNKQMHRQLLGDVARNPYEKGTSMGFNWGSATPEQVAAAKEAALAGSGKMGRAAKAFGSGWSPQMHQQMKAYYKANQ